MNIEENGDSANTPELFNPLAIIELDNKLSDFFKRHTNVKFEGIIENGYSIDLDSMTSIQSKEFFEICNAHRDKWNLKQ